MPTVALSQYVGELTAHRSIQLDDDAGPIVVGSLAICSLPEVTLDLIDAFVVSVFVFCRGSATVHGDNAEEGGDQRHAHGEY